MSKNVKLRKRKNSLRLKGYDYSQNNAYFVTICTKGDSLLLGNVVYDKVILSPSGIIAVECWLAIPEHYEIVQIYEFVIMPNHMHGIIIINNQHDNGRRRDVLLNARSKPPEGVLSKAPTNDYHSKISPEKNTLSVIIRTYKAAVTKLCRAKGIEHFGWQRNYYDHIIRGETDLHSRRKYIRENPQKWAIGEENPVNF